MRKKARNKLREIGRTVPMGGQQSQGIKTCDFTRLGRGRWTISMEPGDGYMVYLVRLKTRAMRGNLLEIAFLSSFSLDIGD